MAHLSWFILILIFYQKLPNWLDSKYNDSSVFKIYISGSSWKINDRSWNIKFAENDNIIIDKKNDSKHGKEILTKIRKKIKSKSRLIKPFTEKSIRNY